MTPSTLLPHQDPTFRDRYVVFTPGELNHYAEILVKATLAELGIKGSPIQSGRIYRRQMVEIIGRVRYDEAVRNGGLIIHKQNPNASNSKVYATRESWERFLKLHTNGTYR